MPQGFLRSLLTPWVIASTLLLAIALFLSIILVAWNLRRPEHVPLPVTAELTVLPATTPTSLVILSGSDSGPATQTPSPNSSASTTIRLESYVQIVGTGGDGLNLRNAPTIESKVRFLGQEAEVFQVREGPMQADGYFWWFLVAPYDENRNGWAVSEYLATIPYP